MTADPLVQAVLALCWHPAFVKDCHACESRRMAAMQRLDELTAIATAAVEALTDSIAPRPDLDTQETR